MFKNRYFIMGLGCGIIIGVLLLQMIWTGQQITPSLSKEQLEQEAKRQGYELVVPKNSEKTGMLPTDNNEQDKQQEDQPAVQDNDLPKEDNGVPTAPVTSSPNLSITTEESKESSEQATTKLPATDTTEQEESKVAIDKQQSPETSDTEKEPVLESKQIRIKPNLTSKQIATQLANDGVIADAAEFEAYIKSKKKQTQLRAGYFIFDVPSTYERALTILISHPNG